jgi:hypothetical protein
MSLREKLCEPFGGLRTETATELEKIADEHAIEFAIFIQDYNYHKSHDVWLNSFNFLVKKFTSQELIEKFKQEKGYDTK